MIIEVVALLFALRVTYENNVQSSEKQIRNAADVTVQFCEGYNLYNQSDEKTISDTMSYFCEMFDISYIFAVKPDLEKKFYVQISQNFYISSFYIDINLYL